MKALFLILPLASGVVSHAVPRSVTVIPPTATPGESIAIFDPFPDNGAGVGFDGPNVQPINDTVFDWWYFDAVALPDRDLDASEETDGKDQSLASIVITLFTATNEAFPFLPPTANSDNVLTAYIWATFPNGTWVSKYIHADQATIVTNARGGGSSGRFDGTGFSWTGSADMSKYVIKVDAEEIMGMKGIVEMETITPSHLPCSVLDSGSQPKRRREEQSQLRPLEVALDLGWSNPIPDALGTVDFTIDGSRLKFQGTAYHDKNWSPRPFDPATKSWYWGHARIGPYSIVWFDLVTSDDKRFVSSYVSCSGEDNSSDEGGSTHLLTASCSPKSLVVTPRDGQAAGNFKVQFEIDGDEHDHCGGNGGVGLGGKRILDVDVFPEQTIAAGETATTAYSRWNGRLLGRMLPSLSDRDHHVDGRDSGHDRPLPSLEYEGVGIYEEFVKLSDD